jgi:selenocysteine-specific elongation factor
MRVIGTAGHVDHGKSTLVEALTGTHPDRLKEEREREMTIDLGFAWLTLPGGEEIGVVDVPGHRDFIENMLAGVGGIDAALFVIAADEGVMPQTREHLAILDILQVQGGVVALTKIDMVGDDPESRDEWLDLVEDDVRKALRRTVLEQAPIVRVSARTGEGIPNLLETLRSALAERPPRPDRGKPRLPVDRIFTIAGFGTVVTGTLSEGKLKVGDEIEVLPEGLRGRVRGLQTHKKKEETAVPGSRTAVNITGVTVDQLQRGSVVAHPGDYRATRKVDARFRLLPDVSQGLEHHTEVKFFTGAAEVVARVRLLGTERLEPGQEGWLQIELAEPVVAVRGDRYILRRPSPGETLGGGEIVDPQSRKRYKRFDEDNLDRLESLEKGSPAEILLHAMDALGPAPLQAVSARSGLSQEQVLPALQELLSSGDAVDLEGKTGAGEALKREGLVASRTAWSLIADRSIKEVETYHKTYPLKRGIPREELKSRLRPVIKSELSQRLYLAILKNLVQQGSIEEAGTVIKLPGFNIRLNPQQQRQAEALMKRFAESPYAPPPLKEAQAEAGEDLVAALLELDKLLLIPPDVLFRKEDYEQLVAEVRKMIQSQGPISAAQVRDRFNTSRRYVLALLEHLDAAGVTVREGDVRRLK